MTTNDVLFFSKLDPHVIDIMCQQLANQQDDHILVHFMQTNKQLFNDPNNTCWNILEHRIPISEIVLNKLSSSLKHMKMVITWDHDRFETEIYGLGDTTMLPNSTIDKTYGVLINHVSNTDLMSELTTINQLKESSRHIDKISIESLIGSPIISIDFIGKTYKVDKNTQYYHKYLKQINILQSTLDWRHFRKIS
jgi:hypothetical protein